MIVLKVLLFSLVTHALPFMSSDLGDSSGIILVKSQNDELFQNWASSASIIGISIKGIKMVAFHESQQLLSTLVLECLESKKTACITSSNSLWTLDLTSKFSKECLETACVVGDDLEIIPRTGKPFNSQLNHRCHSQSLEGKLIFDMESCPKCSTKSQSHQTIESSFSDKYSRIGCNKAAIYSKS